MLILTLSLTVISASAAEISVEDQTESEENFFASIYGEAVENSDKILSALAFIGSVVLAFTYKKGLLPTLNSAIGKLTESVSKIKKSSEEQLDKSCKLLGDAGVYLENTEKCLNALSERLEKLESDLENAKESKSQREKFNLVLMAQTDMLYDIFMTSGLPQYQKDIVGEKISAMKEQIGKGE